MFMYVNVSHMWLTKIPSLCILLVDGNRTFGNLLLRPSCNWQRLCNCGHVRMRNGLVKSLRQTHREQWMYVCVPDPICIQRTQMHTTHTKNIQRLMNEFIFFIRFVLDTINWKWAFVPQIYAFVHEESQRMQHIRLWINVATIFVVQSLQLDHIVPYIHTIIRTCASIM